jgi:hypothetical protein
MALERGIVDKVDSQILQWVEKLSLPRKELGNFPICPFASSATFRVVKKPLSDVAPIDGVDVAIFVVGQVSLSQLLQRCTELNMTYGDYIFLDDHISDPTYVNGVQTNYGHDNLVLVQKRHELLQAREILHKSEYYKYWSEEFYNKIVKG